MATENHNDNHHKNITTDNSITDSSSASSNLILFTPGQVVSTPSALLAMEANDCQPLDLMKRHLTGDWGDVPEEDAEANRRALQEGARLMSSYPLNDGVRIWLITEADRSVTTFLLPEEY